MECVDIDPADVVFEGTGGGAVRRIPREADIRDGNSHMVRLDKLVRASGLAGSNTDAAAKLRAGAVSIDGDSVGPDERFAVVTDNHYFVLRVGRRVRKVRLLVLNDR